MENGAPERTYNPAFNQTAITRAIYNIRRFDEFFRLSVRLRQQSASGYLCVGAPTIAHFLGSRTGSTLKSNCTQSKFHIGQQVRVVAGTKDPDYGFSIGGWSGSIEDIILSEDGDGSWLYDIRWNSNTLKAMRRGLYKRCEKDNLDVTRMVLAEHELEAE